METSIVVHPAIHLALPWRVHDLASDFELLDVWRLPLRGAPRDLPRLVALMSDVEAVVAGASAPARALFALRRSMGALFGWDEKGPRRPIPGCVETSLRDRLAPRPPEPPAGGGEFEPVYVDRREALLELSNDTVHALMHLGWVRERDGYAPHMAVYVKHRGWLGRLYMALITPFRHFVVYPAVLRALRQAWHAEAPLPAAS